MSVESNIAHFHTNLSEISKYAVLRKHDLHIWQVSLVSNHTLLKTCKSVLSAEERKKASWLKFEPDRKKYIISQGVLRLLLADYLKVKTSEIVLLKQKKGKPFAENDNSLFFNMSNSGKLCVYAFTRTGETGIDIEEFRSLPDLDDLIQKNLTMRELDFINKKPADKAINFFRFWTMKEAYLKAIGEGMRLTPDNLEFSIEKDHIKLINQLEIFDQEDWIIKDFVPKTSYFGALVYKNTSTKITHFILE